MKFRSIKGIIYFAGVPYAYTVQARLDANTLERRVQLKPETLRINIADEYDFNSPGIEEFNQAVLNLITDQKRAYATANNQTYC